jgi:hypothetical protein
VSGTYETLERAQAEAYERKRAADPNRDETAAMCWFSDEANRRVTQLKSCLQYAPNAGQQYNEAACFAASLSDLCLWADRAQRGRMPWTKAKAAYERLEREAEAPVLPDLDPAFAEICAGLDRAIEIGKSKP